MASSYGTGAERVTAFRNGEDGHDAGKDDDEALYDLLGTKEYRKDWISSSKTLNRISKLPLLLILADRF